MKWKQQSGQFRLAQANRLPLSSLNPIYLAREANQRPGLLIRCRHTQCHTTSHVAVLVESTKFIGKREAFVILSGNCYICLHSRGTIDLETALAVTIVRTPSRLIFRVSEWIEVKTIKLTLAQNKKVSWWMNRVLNSKRLYIVWDVLATAKTPQINLIFHKKYFSNKKRSKIIFWCVFIFYKQIKPLGKCCRIRCHAIALLTNGD